MTTGATAHAAAMALKDSGAKSVAVAVLAHGR
jgi:predicted amidophosphoribosyltransferase